MIDYEAARIKMVDNQVRTTDVTSHSVLRAFLSVPREAFVPEKLKNLAYIDTDIEVAPGRYIMEASPLAKLIQLAAITNAMPSLPPRQARPLPASDATMLPSSRATLKPVTRPKHHTT